LELLETRLYW